VDNSEYESQSISKGDSVILRRAPYIIVCCRLRKPVCHECMLATRKKAITTVD